MASTTAERFMKALQTAEQAKSPDPLVDLFADGSELTNAARSTSFRGRDGAREFWSEYLSVFDHVQSRFTNVLEQEGRVALEWQAEGVLTSGKPLRYAGVTLLDLEDGHVARFRTYYDATPFLPPSAAAGTGADVPPGI